jgi:hypothetical protein
MVYGEMGRFPMDIVIKLRMIMFWNSLIDNSGKLSSVLYKLMLFAHLPISMGNLTFEQLNLHIYFL